VGIPDKKYGEIVGAFVILDKGADLTEADIRDYALSKIARYKVPKHVFIVDEFPLTASGKIQKYRLRELAVELLNKQEIAVD
jgi:fatty-acyl-CoA synthase